jgi:hypothetical protein
MQQCERWFYSFSFFFFLIYIFLFLVSLEEKKLYKF